jgi:hypothetical protein
MAQYGVIYRLEWNTVPSVLSSSLTIPEQALRVDIKDTETLIEDSDTPEIIPLLADANPLVIKIINNDEDKFTPIRAKQAIIQFKSDANAFQDSLTFADSSDNRWYVEITADGEFIFKGFLMLTDSQQDHLPDPNVVVLTASDHLALLKDINLVTDAGENPSGKYRIAELIALSLKKTGLLLDIIVINNLRHGGTSFTDVVDFDTFPVPIVNFTTSNTFFYVGQSITISGTASNNGTFTVTVAGELGIRYTGIVHETGVTATFTDNTSNGHFYDKVYLDALTFEREIGVSEDCNTVLEKILGEDCFLTQWKGKWYIMRIDEFDDNPIYECVFNTHGVLIGFNSPTTYAKSVGATETRRLANADALRRYDRPYAFVREIFDFTYPSEIPCNIDYVRGDETSDPDVQRTDYTSYDLDCWDGYRLWGSSITTPNFKSAILRTFNLFGDELTRFIMLTKPASSTGSFEYIRSQPIPISLNDRFTWRFDARAMTDTSGDGFILVCMILLYGIDGTVYILRNRDLGIVWDQTLTDVQTSWKLTNDDVTLFRDGLQWAIYDNSNFPKKTEWTTFEMVAAPIPVEGEIRILLFSANQQAGTYDDFDINYQNLSFEYHPYIGGVYDKYKRFHNKVIKDPQGYFNVMREKQTYIQDSPKPLFKGSMFVYNGSRYILTSRWYASAPWALGPPPDTSYIHSYGYIQAFSVWNQFRNGNRILASSALGLGSMWPDALDKWSLTDTNPHVNDRYFLLISFEQNWKTALWSGVFIEDYRTDIGKIYTDEHEFKYLTK